MLGAIVRREKLKRRGQRGPESELDHLHTHGLKSGHRLGTNLQGPMIETKGRRLPCALEEVSWHLDYSEFLYDRPCDRHRPISF